MKIPRPLLVVGLPIVLCATSLFGEISTFIAEDGAWNDSASWDYIPTMDDEALINNGGIARIADGGTYDIFQLTLSGGSSLIISDGILNISNPDYKDGVLALSGGTLSISNGALNLTAPAQWGWGTGATISTISIGPGGSFSASENMLIGVGNAGEGVLDINGGMLQLALNKNLLAGLGTSATQTHTKGIINIYNEGTLSLAGQLMIGRDAYGYASLTLNNGTISATRLSFADNLETIGIGVFNAGSVTITGDTQVGGVGMGSLSMVKSETITPGSSLSLITNNLAIGNGGTGGNFLLKYGSVTVTNSMTVGAWNSASVSAGHATISGSEGSLSVKNIFVGHDGYDSAVDNVSTLFIQDVDKTVTLANGSLVVGSNVGRIDGTFSDPTGRATLSGQSGVGVATIAGSNLVWGNATQVGNIIVGNSGTGSLTIENSSITISQGSYVTSGAVINNLPQTAAGDVWYVEHFRYEDGSGTLTMNNSSITADNQSLESGRNNRFFVGQGGTGIAELTNSTLSNFTMFQVGVQVNRVSTLNATASEQYGGALTLSGWGGSGTGVFTMTNSVVNMARSSDTAADGHLSIGMGGTGTFKMVNSTFSTNGGIFVGEDVYLLMSTYSNGVASTYDKNVFGNGTFIMEGGGRFPPTISRWRIVRLPETLEQILPPKHTRRFPKVH